MFVRDCMGLPPTTGCRAIRGEDNWFGTARFFLPQDPLITPIIIPPFSCRSIKSDQTLNWPNQTTKHWNNKTQQEKPTPTYLHLIGQTTHRIPTRHCHRGWGLHCGFGHCLRCLPLLTEQKTGGRSADGHIWWRPSALEDSKRQQQNQIQKSGYKPVETGRNQKLPLQTVFKTISKLTKPL